MFMIEGEDNQVLGVCMWYRSSKAYQFRSFGAYRRIGILTGVLTDLANFKNNNQLSHLIRGGFFMGVSIMGREEPTIFNT